MKKLRIAAIILSGIFAVAMITGCGSSSSSSSSSQKDKSLSGSVKVLTMSGAGKEITDKLPSDYKTTEINSYTDFKDKIKNGNYDLAIVSANTAAVMYNKTGSGVVALSPVMLGDIYVLSNGYYVTNPDITSIKGKTVFVLGTKSAEEKTLGKLMNDDSMYLDSSITLKNEDTMDALKKDFKATNEGIAVVSQPIANQLKKISNVREMLDLQQLWKDKGYGSIPTKVLIANADFVKNKSDEIGTVMNDFAEAVGSAKKDSSSDLVFYEASNRGQMILKNYIKKMYNYNSSSIGGSKPGSDFYYQN